MFKFPGSTSIFLKVKLQAIRIKAKHTFFLQKWQKVLDRNTTMNKN